jgi:hypothetical protein
VTAATLQEETHAEGPKGVFVASEHSGTQTTAPVHDGFTQADTHCASDDLDESEHDGTHADGVGDAGSSQLSTH